MKEWVLILDGLMCTYPLSLHWGTGEVKVEVFVFHLTSVQEAVNRLLSCKKQKYKTWSKTKTSIIYIGCLMYTYIHTYVHHPTPFLCKNPILKNHTNCTHYYVYVGVQQLPAEPSSLYNTKYNAIPAHCMYTTYIHIIYIWHTNFMSQCKTTMPYCV